MSTVLPESWTSPTGLEQEPLSAADEARYGRNQIALIWLRFVRNRAALVGGGVVGLLYVMAVFANFIAPYDADQRFDSAIYTTPGSRDAHTRHRQNRWRRRGIRMRSRAAGS